MEGDDVAIGRARRCASGLTQVKLSRKGSRLDGNTAQMLELAAFDETGVGSRLSVNASGDEADKEKRLGHLD